ncbi:hypothetical protein Mapa_005620 [Marchantia paleacea]|nr:hypothetical protein Mapa_005620 [Marchantia paleacea]
MQCAFIIPASFSWGPSHTDDLGISNALKKWNLVCNTVVYLQDWYRPFHSIWCGQPKIHLSSIVTTEYTL